jgi:hypothetical protein
MAPNPSFVVPAFHLLWMVPRTTVSFKIAPFSSSSAKMNFHSKKPPTATTARTIPPMIRFLVFLFFFFFPGAPTGAAELFISVSSQGLILLGYCTTR